MSKENGKSMTHDHKRNMGLDLLKLFASVAVVGLHNGGGVPGNNSAVPIFMAISIYFSINMLLSGDWGKLVKREQRILYPFVFWSVLPFIVLPSKVIGGWSDLLWQLSFGSTIAPPLYFLLILAFFTLLLFLMNIVFRKYFWYAFMAISIGAIVLQYGKVHILAENLPVKMSITIGRIVELLPCAFVGACLNKFLPLNEDMKCGRKWLPIIIIFALLAILSRKVLPRPLGFGYQGIELPIMAAGFVSTAVIAGKYIGRKVICAERLLPFAVLAPGVYYAHAFVGQIIDIFWDFPLGWARTIAVFVISGCLAFLILKVPYLKRFAS